MTNRRWRLGLIDHIVGAACAAALLSWSSEVASAVSIPLSEWLESSAGGTRIHFLGGVEGPAWTALLGLLLLGLTVTGSERLVASGKVGAWVPPVALLALTAGGLLPVFRAGGSEPNEAAVLSVTLGVLASLALSSYWCGGLLTRWVRRAGASSAGIGDAG